MESKYNLLTRLLKNIKNVVTPDGSIAGSGGGVLVVHEVTEIGEVLLTGTLPNFSGYAWRTETEEGNTNTELYYIDVAVESMPMNLDDAVVIIYDGDHPVQIDNTGDIKFLKWDAGVLSILVGWSGNSFGYDRFTNESEVTGLVMTVYASLDKRLDKTYKEITDAGSCVLDLLDGGHHHIAYVSGFEFDEVKGGVVEFNMGIATLEYTCSTENDYPERSQRRSGSGRK